MADQANQAWFPEKIGSFFNYRNRAVNPLNGLIRFMTRYLLTEDEQVTVVSWGDFLPQNKGPLKYPSRESAKEQFLSPRHLGTIHQFLGGGARRRSEKVGADRLVGWARKVWRAADTHSAGFDSKYSMYVGYLSLASFLVVLLRSALSCLPSWKFPLHRGWLHLRFHLIKYDTWRQFG